MSRAYEVRDVQYLLGLLADEGVINPQEIGATGGSYGGGMSLQLGSLKDRVELPNGELIPWVSPKGTPMKIAATAPEFPWTDLAQSLQPNGSNLDYVANAPYAGVLGNHEFGIQKQNWNESLYFGGLFAGGFYAPPPAEPEANITEWFNFNSTGGPYNGKPLAVQQETQLPNHGAYYTNLSEPPAPALMENGWNDDLFPVDQTVDYYNKVRASYPTAAMKLFYFDLGHNPRSSDQRLVDRRGQAPGRPERLVRLLRQRRRQRTRRSARRRDGDHERLPRSEARGTSTKRRTGRASRRARSG